jgi:hypothetical protein
MLLGIGIDESHSRSRSLLGCGFFLPSSVHLSNPINSLCLTRNSSCLMPRTLYHLAIYRIDTNLVYSASNKSLRESVRLAGLHVSEMDNYQRVVRELIRIPGAYAATFRLSPAEEQQTCFVLLYSAKLMGSDFIFPPLLGGASISGSSS